MSENDVVIYTDGACRGNPGPGGWGAILSYGNNQKQLSGAEGQSTNNRMELMAAIRALESLTRSCHVNLYTDSQYVRKGILEWMENWKKSSWKTASKKQVKNQDLWMRLDAAIGNHDIEWHWVKGHSGVEGNEIADSLANEAIDKMLAEVAE